MYCVLQWQRFSELCLRSYYVLDLCLFPKIGFQIKKLVMHISKQMAFTENTKFMYGPEDTYSFLMSEHAQQQFRMYNATY